MSSDSILEYPSGPLELSSEGPSEHPKPQGREPTTAVNTARLSGVAVAALATAACGGGGSNSGSTSVSSGGVASNPVAPPVIRRPASDAEASRFLQQVSLASSTQEISELNDQGYEPWLDTQMSRSNDQSAREFFTSRGFDRVDDNRYYNSAAPGEYMIWSQLLSGGSGVRKRFALALSEFFVVSMSGISSTWRGPAIGAYWDLLNENAFGDFRQLLEEITLNPAMGTFLNTRGNRRANPRSGRVPDENYGREIMQLFTIGLFELNPDGSTRLSGGSPIETYTNEDVNGIAKVFTGYDFDFSGIGFTQETNGTRQIADPEYVYRRMTADPSRWQRPRSEGFHSEEEKSFLGLTIPAGTGPEESLRLALDHLVAHPNVGPFFARQMIQRLVTSNPSLGYVQRVASVFDDNGNGVRGDLGAVFKAIVLDDEALDPSGISDPTFGKLREPILRFVQFGRTFGMRSTTGDWRLRNTSDESRSLGQSPLRSPSVFNFFRPTYFPPNSQTSANGLLAPEFQLVNETSAAGYVNFMERALSTEGGFFRDVELDYSSEIDIADDSAALVDRLDLLLTANQLSSDVRSLIVSAIDAMSIEPGDDEQEDRLRRVQAAVLLTMASTDYLIQK
ncbi:MAG: DUF1800 family protein [Pseudomonadota bacterium]